MESKSKKIVVLIVGVYLLIQDYLEGTNNYELFNKLYVEKEKKTNLDIAYDYYISNPNRWKNKINTLFSLLTKETLIKIYNEIADLYYKIYKK